MGGAREDLSGTPLAAIDASLEAIQTKSKAIQTEVEEIEAYIVMTTCIPGTGRESEYVSRGGMLTDGDASLIAIIMPLLGSRICRQLKPKALLMYRKNVVAQNNQIHRFQRSARAVTAVSGTSLYLFVVALH